MSSGAWILAASDLGIEVTAPFISVLNPTVYENYDRGRFIDLLNGWGWTGLDTPPWWYGGVL